MFRSVRPQLTSSNSNLSRALFCSEDNRSLALDIGLHVQVSEHEYHWAHAVRVLHVAPPPLLCVLQRFVNTVRFSMACLFATLVLPRRTFAERRRAVKSPTALPTHSKAMASLQCRTQPLSPNRARARTLAWT